MIRKKTNKGFTLLELLISISIISIIVLAFSTMIMSSIKGNTKNDKDISALNLAQSEIEVVRKQIKDGKTSLKNSENETLEIKLINDSIEDTNSDPIEDTKNIYYKDVDGKSFEVKFYISKDEDSLYKLWVRVKSKQKNDEENWADDYFSKKYTELVTEVFGI